MKLNNLLEYLLCERVEPEEVSFEVATNAFFYHDLDENVLDVISNNAIPVYKRLLRYNEFSIRDCDMAARAWHKVLKKAGIQSQVRSGYYIDNPKTLKAVKKGELSPPGVSDHVWLTIDGNIFDPTAGQFKGPIKLNHYVYDDGELNESIQHDTDADEAYLLNTDPMELDEDEYLNKYEQILIKKFPDSVIELDNATNPQDKVRIQYVIIPAANKTDLKFWLQSKLEMEGEPEDDETIGQIGKDGVIYRPIVLDTRNDYTIEGRHRLTAALKYNLDCPALLVLDDAE